MQPKQPAEQAHIETQLIRRRTAAGPHREQVTPLYMASGFTFPDAATARAVYALSLIHI